MCSRRLLDFRWDRVANWNASSELEALTGAVADMVVGCAMLYFFKI